VCLGRHTLTGLLTAGGRPFDDWSADYRVFSQARFEPDRVFEAIRGELLEHLPEGAPLVTAMDDTLVRKTGARTPGVAWRRDPLGPPFQTNFVRGQRFLQLSAAAPVGDGASPARMVPIGFHHAPTPLKPRKNAGDQAWSAYRREQDQAKLSRLGKRRIGNLRADMDRDPNTRARPLWMVVDGSFTNREILQNLPERTTLIGRIRKDAQLHHAPPPRDPGATGRRRQYGPSAPTPEQLRQDETVPWERVEVFAAGELHRFKVKILRDLRWRVAGGNTPLMLVVIAPLGYRPRKGAHLLYRQPAYLICTNDQLPVDQVLQAYVWRWDIEVNFRDEKTLLGVGQAQVRNPQSVALEPALMVAAYATLLLAGLRAYGNRPSIELLPRPKWRTQSPPPRISTARLINLLRQELWGQAIDSGFSDFARRAPADPKSEKQNPRLETALFYAIN